MRNQKRLARELPRTLGTGRTSGIELKALGNLQESQEPLVYIEAMLFKLIKTKTKIPQFWLIILLVLNTKTKSI